MDLYYHIIQKMYWPLYQHTIHDKTDRIILTTMPIMIIVWSNHFFCFLDVLPMKDTQGWWCSHVCVRWKPPIGVTGSIQTQPIEAFTHYPTGSCCRQAWQETGWSAAAGYKLIPMPQNVKWWILLKKKKNTSSSNPRMRSFDSPQPVAIHQS